jgi:hypothetical protein
MQYITKIKQSASKTVFYDGGGRTWDSSLRENKIVYSSEKMVWKEMVSHLKLRALSVSLTKVTVYENGAHYELNSYRKRFGKILIYFKPCAKLFFKTNVFLQFR